MSLLSSQTSALGLRGNYRSRVFLRTRLFAFLLRCFSHMRARLVQPAVAITALKCTSGVLVKFFGRGVLARFLHAVALNVPVASGHEHMGRPHVFADLIEPTLVAIA